MCLYLISVVNVQSWKRFDSGFNAESRLWCLHPSSHILAKNALMSLTGRLEKGQRFLSRLHLISGGVPCSVQNPWHVPCRSFKKKNLVSKRQKKHMVLTCSLFTNELFSRESILNKTDL